MTAVSDQIEIEVARIVARRAGIPLAQVGPGTRLWHDLGLAGDDFADVIEDLHRAHAVTLNGRLGDYCPTEGLLLWWFYWWPFKRTKAFRELTISELAMAARSSVDRG